MKIKRLKSPSDSFDIQFPERKAFDVVGFGLNSVDHLCVVPQFPEFDTKTEINKYEVLPGGQVATATLFLSRMGRRVRYIGKVGGDDFGRRFLESLASESIDISSIVVERSAMNQYAFIIIDETSGERTILWQRDERLNFRKSELDVNSVCSGKILHLDGYDSASALYAATICREEGIPVSIDLDMAVPDCEALINTVDFLIVSSDFCKEFTGISNEIEAFRELSASFHGFWVMTIGAEGAVVSLDGQCLAFPGLKVEAVDTTGAGDIFHGGFLHGLLQNWTLEKIMAFSNASSGISCKYLGAQSGIRPLNEILQCMNTQNLLSCRRL
jgi:sulfofructose kinase